MKIKNQKGFTLIELLVVIAIIGVLSTLAVTSLNSARAKSRDAKRITDIKQIQTALELFYVDKSSYPDGTELTLGGATAKCLDNTGWKGGGCTAPYLPVVPANPSPNGANYVYNKTESGASYTLTTTLETTVNGLTENINASPTGITEAD